MKKVNMQRMMSQEIEPKI